MESEISSPYWKDLGHTKSQRHLIQLLRHCLNNTHLNIILPCTRRYSFATTRVSFTKIGYDVFWRIGECCFYNANFGIRVLAVTRLQQPVWRYKVGRRTKVLPVLTNYFERFSVIRGLKVKELSRYSRNDCISDDFFLLNLQTKLFICHLFPT